MGRQGLGVLFTLLLAARPAVAQPTAISLADAIAQALVSSPQLVVPTDGRELARIRETQAESRFGLRLTPSFQTGTDAQGLFQRDIGIGVSRQLPIGTNLQFRANSYRFGDGPAEFKDAGYTVGFSQPLLRGFGAAMRRDLALARRGVTSADWRYEDARADLVINVARSFFAALKQQRFVENGVRSFERAKTLQASSKARAEVGLATELDVLRAELLAAQAEASVAAAREALEDARDGLKTLLGRSLEADLEISEEDLSDPALYRAGLAPEEPGPGGGGAELVDRLTYSALASRRDLRDARDRIGDARLNESAARWNLMPPVSFDLAYSRRGLGSSSAIFDELLTGWRYGLSTSYALDRSDERAAAATAAIGIRAAEREALDVEQRVRSEVRQAYREWQKSATSVDIQSRAVQIAQRQVRLAELRYERGLGGNFDVIDAENSVYQAQTALVSAEIDRALAGLTVKRVAGLLDPDQFTR